MSERMELENGLVLNRDENGLSLHWEDQVLRGDFTRMLPRLKNNNLSKELLVKAAKIKDSDHPLMAVDATAGLGGLDPSCSSRFSSKDV